MAGPPRADWGSADAATAAYWKERTAAFHSIVAWSPTIDPENLKLLSQELVVGAGVHLILHAWASTPVIEEDGRVGGIVFESKEGRLAIRAKVTIDCTGDADIFHRAGAVSDSDVDERDIHHCINTAWLFGGVDMPRWIAFKTGDPDGFKSFMERGRAACGGLFERPFVSWRYDVALFMGPRLAGYSAIKRVSADAGAVHDAFYLPLTNYRNHWERSSFWRRGSGRSPQVVDSSMARSGRV